MNHSYKEIKKWVEPNNVYRNSATTEIRLNNNIRMYKMIPVISFTPQLRVFLLALYCVKRYFTLKKNTVVLRPPEKKC